MWYSVQELIVLYAKNLHDNDFEIDRALFERVLDDAIEAQVGSQVYWKENRN